MKTSIKIGRDNTNDVIINEPRVSRSHAIVSNLGNGNYDVKDLGSSNGTFVNGQRIMQQIIYSGDKLQVAESIVDWEDAFQEKPESQTISIIEEDAFAKIKKTITIGSSADNDFVMDDNFISKHHAKISLLQNGNYYLQDMGSSNGSFINGTKVIAKNFNKTDIVKIANNDLPNNWFQHQNIQPHFFKDNKKTLLISFAVIILISAATLIYFNSCKWFGWRCNLSAQKIYIQNKNSIVFIKHDYFYTIYFNGKKYFVGKNKQFNVVEANISIENLKPYNTISGSGCFVKNDGSILTSAFVVSPWFNSDEKIKMLNEVKESKTIEGFDKHVNIDICGMSAELKFIPNGMVNNPQNYIDAIAKNECIYSDTTTVIIQSIKKSLPQNATVVEYSFDSKNQNHLHSTSKYFYSSINTIAENELINDTFYESIDTFNINKLKFIPLNNSLPQIQEGCTVLNERGELIGWVQQNQTNFIHPIFKQINK